MALAASLLQEFRAACGRFRRAAVAASVSAGKALGQTTGLTWSNEDFEIGE